ncbi:MAG: L,D-transpeptidase [Deltaproteobacteria bacterium]|uniref:L,D-transpeptidase n=1 Tax=Candidatus Zymogenus saltonus TaxID=2844893 RepID=A0A9D8KK35_9DELT|nr:L,D-transpeptidase [Candidatus Zymogenus saltonus]
MKTGRDFLGLFPGGEWHIVSGYDHVHYLKISRVAGRFAALLLFILFLCPVSNGEEGKIIFVIDDEKRLYIYEGERLKFDFPCETGIGGMGKTREGDRKTPVGRYMIIWMASKRGDNEREGTQKIIDGITWCEDSKIYYGPEGPADERLWTDAYGGDDAAVMGLDYPNEADKGRGYTGDCIEIHATKRLKNGRLTPSGGCIKMFCEDALFLYNHVEVNTPVVIARTRGDLLSEYPFLREARR